MCIGNSLESQVLLLILGNPKEMMLITFEFFNV